MLAVLKSFWEGLILIKGVKLESGFFVKNVVDRPTFIHEAIDKQVNCFSKSLTSFLYALL